MYAEMDVSPLGHLLDALQNREPARWSYHGLFVRRRWHHRVGWFDRNDEWGVEILRVAC
jgi:hypothetical protein